MVAVKGEEDTKTRKKDIKRHPFIAEKEMKRCDENGKEPLVSESKRTDFSII